MSAVDSGNLAGHLIALEHACLAMIDQRPARAPCCAGSPTRRGWRARPSAPSRPQAPRRRGGARALADALGGVVAATARPVGSPAEWAGRLAELASQAAAVVTLAGGVAALIGADAAAEVVAWADALDATVESHRRDLDAAPSGAESVGHRLAVLAASAQAMVAEMSFGFLFDSVRQLFAIGYRVDDAALDPGRYDLLASKRASRASSRSPRATCPSRTGSASAGR
ncbi:MAG: hypothetical protein U0470_06770 [Anaerolineae bacterium]